MKEKMLNYLSFNDKKTFVIRVVLIFSAFLLLISMLLPYATAKADFKEDLEQYGERIVDKDTGFTGNDLININIFEFITIHTHDTSYDGSGLIVGLLIAIIVLTIITIALIGLKKDILCTISSIIIFLLVLLVNFDFSDRGVVGYNYEWSISHLFYIILPIITTVGSITLKILGKLNKVELDIK